MHRSIVLFVSFLMILPAVHADISWPVGAPAEHGLNAAALDGLRQRLEERNTRALLVVRNGRIVYEWYAAGSGPAQLQGTASVAKAMIGGMSLLVALNDGRLKADDLACKYIPAWKDHPQKSRITIRHLATHTSGIEDAEQDNLPHDQLPGWKGAFWKRQPDPFSIAIHQAPVIFEPGTRYHYSNTGMAALAYAVTASLRGAKQQDIRTLLKERIMDPLEIPESDWSVGYRQSYELDGLKLYANWGGAAFTPRAAARVAQLMLEKGNRQFRQLVATEWVETMLSYAGMPLPERSEEQPAPASGLCWYTNHDGVWPAVPRDAFAAAGAGHQLILVVPSLKLIAVRNGTELTGRRSRDGFWGPAVEEVFNGLMAAVEKREAKAPYPPSPVIRGVTFAPESEIVRKAIDSDNWPITWADDGDLYTSYGDGWGFDPRTEKKLSQGIARVAGTPENFEGFNIRSETAERPGDGKRGPKASGMLMVDGVLYMWVRNTDNSQIAWSTDRGRTWEWGFRFDTSFGSPAFLNFGRNYAGARDRYVYVYSQDGPSAYESDDGMVLARVPKDRIRERGAYEFFVGQEAGRPVWTKDIAKRGRVFSYPGNTQRVDVVYNPGVKRYLMALGYGHRGGWGIFDAPEPWGPWTTAFHTENWGLGGTHGYRLPSKWISEDGRTMHLVFSGVKLPDITYDAFCVRKFTLELEGKGAKAPYAPSPVIRSVTFDWSTHKRDAQGSDNWQLTWADDGHLYGAWGDGGGFGGTNSDGRVSLGVARVEGGWQDYKGVNVWGGKNGLHPATVTGKSWGMIGVKGALYMWVSPGSPLAEMQTEARLYRSTDHAATWQPASWSFTREEELTIPTILQFGRDYQGARDGYVYHYFIHPRDTGSDSIQRPGNIYLARSPLDRLMDRGAYEFFAGAADGRASWTADAARKRPVFQDPNGVGWVLSASYNRGLKRYLLLTDHIRSNRGNLGVFDAPEPWGPWTTAHYAIEADGTNFGAGKIEANTFFWNLPAKWQSADGKEFTLVFTGSGRGKNNDSFNLIRGRFEVKQ